MRERRLKLKFVQGGHIGDRMYGVKIQCGPGYPDDPPQITFINKVAIPCVDHKGRVNFKKIPEFEWSRDSYLFQALLNVRKAMKPNGVAQACQKIPDGTGY